MTRIYLIRHAQAEGNLYRLAQGHWNGKITEMGKAQIDALYASDLSRAMETAGALQRGRDLPLVTTPRLREMCMGVWEGQAWGNITFRWPEQMEFFSNNPAGMTVPGSENFYELQKRIKSMLLEIAKEHDGKTVGVVSHGMAIRSFLCEMLGYDSAGISNVPHGDNTCVSLLEISGDKINVVFYNDNSHLGEELSTFARQKWWIKGAAADHANLRFEPISLKSREEAQLYQKSYADAWKASHGSDDGFVPSIYLSSARAHVKESPESLVKVMSGNDFAGIVELSPERGKNDGYGWISLFYLVPEYRHKGFGVQLLGYSAAFYEIRGRENMRLHVAVTNDNAISFYKHNDFRQIGIEPGVSSEQYLMERPV